MLNFHFLNVGHGSSTVIELVAPDGIRHYGLVDSNKKGAETPPGLRLLKTLGAERLAFVALTHPHADHYRGMGAILAAFHGRVDHAFSFPVERDRRRLEKWLLNWEALAQTVVNTEVLEEIDELTEVVLRFADMGSAWEPLSNYESRMHVEAMQEVDISLLLPPSEVKGDFFDRIARGESAFKQDKDNALSLAIRFSYAGKTVVLGGDGTLKNWTYIRQRTRKPGPGFEFGYLNADVVCLPHHGSAKDSGDLVLDFLFGPDIPGGMQDRYAIVSADGRSHPDPAVLQSLRRKGVKPYCTGLSKACSRAQPVSTISSNVIEPVLERFLDTNALPVSRAPVCQGDITVSIAANGEITVRRQFEAACALRGEMDFMAALQ